MPPIVANSAVSGTGTPRTTPGIRARSPPPASEPHTSHHRLLASKHLPSKYRTPRRLMSPAPNTWGRIGPSGPHRRGSKNTAGRKNGKQGCKHRPWGRGEGWHSETSEGTADLEGDEEEPGVMGAPGEGPGKLEGRGRNCSSPGILFFLLLLFFF